MEPEDYNIDLTNIESSTITISVPSATPNVGDIWLDTATMNTNVYTHSNDWITITGTDSIDLSNIIIEGIEFEDKMPDVSKIEDMCRDYPALEKAYENFKTIYAMVHQDWQGKQSENES